MKKIKVLHIITHLPIGGAQDNTLLTVEGLNRARYDVTLLCGPEGEWLRRLEAMSHVHRVYIRSLMRAVHPFHDLAAGIQLFRHIRKHEYQIVHTHSSKPGIIGRIAAKLAGVPIIVHTIHGFPFHDFMFKPMHMICVWLERLASRCSHKIITVSLLNLEKAVNLRLGSRDRFVNIYSGIQFEKFRTTNKPEIIKRSLGLNSNDIVIGMIGRLFVQKAPQYFVNAIPQILRNYHNAHFLLIGDGELKPALIRLAEELGVEEHVHFLGFREDIPDLLSIFDVFVLTSLWEGLGRSLTEAMAMAKPVVATAVEGVPELVEHQRTGLLVPPKDAKSIAEAILHFLRNPGTARNMGIAAQKNVMKHFAAQKMINDIEYLYESLLNVQNS